MALAIEGPVPARMDWHGRDRANEVSGAAHHLALLQTHLVNRFDPVA